MIDAEILEVVKETDNVSLVRLSVKDFQFKPGQWISLWCDDFLEEGTDKPLRRAFSIASLPGEYLELCIARGKALSAFLMDAKPGTKVHFNGPFGLFCLNDAKELMFLAGGTGVAPFRPMIHEALKKNIPVTLIYSVRDEESIIYKEELEALTSNPNFKLIITLTRQNWDGETGRIPTFLEKYYKPCDVYICGPPVMVESCETKLIELSLPKDKIHAEKWG